MKKWAVSYILAFAVQLSLCPGRETIRGFQSVDPILLEKKVPIGYGRVFLQAGRQNDIDPVVLAAISAHESGAWKSRIARRKNNWMGLMTRRGARSFGTPEESIFYAAKLLNRKPFKDRNTLSEIAPIYCAERPGYWEASVLRWEHELRGWQTADAKNAQN
jgi:mannosyl-glycoprotein endo-beta-N-acetylglucosaminidase